MPSTELTAQQVTPDAFTVVDVRSPAEFAAGHLPAAVNIPLDELPDAVPALRAAAERRGLLLVCASGVRSERARDLLAEAGVEAAALTGGTGAWQAAGRELHRIPGARQVWAMDRQVRFTAGGIVLTALLLDRVRPGARWVAAGIGAGLVYSGLSGTCGLAALLARLPHNRQTPAGATDWRSALAG
ncbi:rhodanese-like domain-containing protein [Streptomyces sp. NPDC092296]|uniref:rhodanese-like domain-containing protein n=1 Tax=Streptomyces sp. NPDC092296 TaxID=3366012 RepID=UPI0037F5E3AB